MTRRRISGKKPCEIIITLKGGVAEDGLNTTWLQEKYPVMACYTHIHYSGSF